MKIHILGGGPAGLYFAILMKQAWPGHRIEIWERNPANNTFGWGVVFSARTIEGLRQPDPLTHQRLTAAMRTWENVDIVHRDQMTSVAGNRFSGIARIELLRILQMRCQELHIPVHFCTPVQDPAQLGEADLVVGADGVHSRLRQRYQHLFQPEIRQGRNRYIWYGTPQSFGGLTLIFRPQGERLFMAHAYRYNPQLSTFIVEVDKPTWASIRTLGEARSRQLLSRVFAPDLQGESLLSNGSRWIRFTNLRNRHWWAENKVLLGDALHTAHFSIGSGTKLALEDALALWRAFQEYPSPQEALPAFEAARRPAVERLQAAAETSQRWFEEARQQMDQESIPFAYEVMTRSERVDDAELERRDPDFARVYQEWRASGSCGVRRD